MAYIYNCLLEYRKPVLDMLWTIVRSMHSTHSTASGDKASNSVQLSSSGGDVGGGVGAGGAGQGGGREAAPDAVRVGYKLLVYLRCLLSGEAFPPGQVFVQRRSEQPFNATHPPPLLLPLNTTREDTKVDSTCLNPAQLRQIYGWCWLAMQHEELSSSLPLGSARQEVVGECFGTLQLTAACFCSHYSAMLFHCPRSRRSGAMASSCSLHCLFQVTPKMIVAAPSISGSGNLMDERGLPTSGSAPLRPSPDEVRAQLLGLLLFTDLQVGVCVGAG
eukprot:scaffold33796_cov17-Tisochrysis_lutea.AAC.2